MLNPALAPGVAAGLVILIGAYLIGCGATFSGSAAGVTMLALAFRARQTPA